MTEKEKTEACDNAIERAKKLHDKIDIEEIFPKPKESDDMKIKTAILNHFKKMWGNCQDDVCGVHVEDVIAWLEKQGEQTKNDMFFTEEEKQKLFDGIFKSLRPKKCFKQKDETWGIVKNFNLVCYRGDNYGK